PLWLHARGWWDRMAWGRTARVRAGRSHREQVETAAPPAPAKAALSRLEAAATAVTRRATREEAAAGTALTWRATREEESAARDPEAAWFRTLSRYPPPARAK